jgi:hypothetical protein
MPYRVHVIITNTRIVDMCYELLKDDLWLTFST